MFDHRSLFSTEQSTGPVFGQTHSEKHCSERITFRMSKFKIIVEDKNKLDLFLSGKRQMTRGVVRGIKAQSTKHRNKGRQEMD